MALMSHSGHAHWRLSGRLGSNPFASKYFEVARTASGTMTSNETTPGNMQIARRPIPSHTLIVSRGRKGMPLTIRGVVEVALSSALRGSVRGSIAAALYYWLAAIAFTTATTTSDDSTLTPYN